MLSSEISEVNSTLSSEDRQPFLFTLGPPPKRVSEPTTKRLSPELLPPSLKEPIIDSSSNGVSVAISLAQPVIYLSGYDKSEMIQSNPTILGGSLLLRLSKPAKLKNIHLKLRGRSEVTFLEIAPFRKANAEHHEIISHTWTFYDSSLYDQELSFGASSTRIVENKTKLPAGIFPIGEYVYNFETTIPNTLPESLESPGGWVRYELEAVIQRFGVFKFALRGKMPLEVTRLVGGGEFYENEPLVVTRTWDNRLFYEAIISQKAVSLGSPIPIRLTLTPIDVVRILEINVFITEIITYKSKSSGFFRTGPVQKFSLYRKTSEDNQNFISNNLFEPTIFSINAELTDNERKKIQIDSTFEHIQVSHMLKISIRAAKPAKNVFLQDKFYVITIGAPILILSSRNNSENTLLPPYEQYKDPLPIDCVADQTKSIQEWLKRDQYTSPDKARRLGLPSNGLFRMNRSMSADDCAQLEAIKMSLPPPYPENKASSK